MYPLLLLCCEAGILHINSLQLGYVLKGIQNDLDFLQPRDRKAHAN